MSKEETKRKRGEMATDEGTGFRILKPGEKYKSALGVKSNWKPDPKEDKSS